MNATTTTAPKRGTIATFDPWGSDTLAYEVDARRMYVREVKPGALYRVFAETGFTVYPHMEVTAEYLRSLAADSLRDAVAKMTGVTL